MGVHLLKLFTDNAKISATPIIFKAEENLGHDTCPEVEQLRDDFFDYALDIKKERDEKGFSQIDMAAMVAQTFKKRPVCG